MTASLATPTDDICPWCRKPVDHPSCDPHRHRAFAANVTPSTACTGCGSPSPSGALFCNDTCGDESRASELTWRRIANRPAFGNTAWTRESR